MTMVIVRLLLCTVRPWVRGTGEEENHRQGDETMYSWKLFILTSGRVGGVGGTQGRALVFYLFTFRLRCHPQRE